MKKKEILLAYLKKHSKENFISSKVLSKMLGVTDRSIRYYVKQLNEALPHVIETSQKGYKYNSRQDGAPNLADDRHSRRFKILKSLLKNGEMGINLFDLSDMLWVSEATIRQDMISLQKLIDAEGLRITQHDFYYYLKGNDDQKHQLIMRLIRQQGNHNFNLAAEMQNFLGDISLSAIIAICTNSFKRYHFYTNNYFLQNFILHLIIAIYQQKITKIKTVSSPSLPMIEDISVNLFESYEITLDMEDKCELALLCDGEKGYHYQQANAYLDHEVSVSLYHALKEISDVFLIDFTDEKLLNRLLFHMQHLYRRIKDRKVKRNLSVVEIKVRYPILFDIAVYLSSLIANDLNIEIAEDEITFLALHIGSFLDDHKQDNHQIKTKLNLSGYLDREEIMIEALKKYFNDELALLTDSVDDKKVELLLSTEKIVENQNYESVQIHEFLTKKDIMLIREAINRLKYKKYRYFLSTFLPQLIPENAFLILEGSLSKCDVFLEIGAWFFDNQFTKQGFSEKLFERESLASTAFNSGIAIPHAIKYEGKKTGMLILKPEIPLKWDDQNISLIISFTINPDDAICFNQLFPDLVDVLTEKYNIAYLVASKNRGEFLNKMIELLS